MPILGILVAALAILWGLIQLLPVLIFRGDSLTSALILELVLSGFTAFCLALTTLLASKSFFCKRILMYVQLLSLLLSASFSLYYQSAMLYGVTLFFLVILLGIHYRLVGRKMFIGLTFYYSCLIINFSYQKGDFFEGLGTFVFLHICYVISYLAYHGLYEEEGSLKMQLVETIEAQKEVIRTKEALLTQLQPVHYQDKELMLTKAEKSLLDCIWLYREVGNKELSRLTGKSESTIRNRIFSICRKLGYDRRTKLLTFVLESPWDIEELPVVEDIYYG